MDETEMLEGKLTKILYSYESPFGANLPSRFQVIRNYEDAILKLGGKRIYSNSNDDAWGVANFKLDDKRYWISVYDLIYNPVDQYSLIVLSRRSKRVYNEVDKEFADLRS